MVRWCTLLALCCCWTVAFSQQFSVHPRVETSTVVGVAPMPLFFDATASTSNDTTINTFHDLHYQWNFGDFYSGVWNTVPKSKNRASAPLTAHVFDSIGLHVIELEIFKNTEYTVLKPLTIKVQNPNDFYAGEKTICFSTTGNFADVPYQAKKVTIKDLSDVEPYLADSVRILFRRGDTILTNAGLDLSSYQHLTIGAYGHRLKINTFGISSNAPIILMEGNTPLFIFSHADTISRSHHIKITELNLFNINPNNTSSAIVANGSTHNNLMYRLKISGFAPAIFYLKEQANFQEIFITDCMIRNDKQSGDLVELNGERVAIFGNQMNNHSQDGDVLSMHWARKAVIANNLMNDAGNEKHCFDFSPIVAESHNYSEEVIIADNYFETSGKVKTIVKIGGKTADKQDLRNVIVDRNFIHAKADRQAKIGLEISADDLTIKNNIINGTGGSYRRFTGIRVSNSSDSIRYSNISITNNTIFKKEWVDMMIGVRVGKYIDSSFVVNNLVYSPDAMDLRIVFNEGKHTTDESNIYPFVHPFIAEEPSKPIDFQLDSVSLVLDKGIESPCAFKDFMEKERSGDTRIDIGAFQFTAFPVTAYTAHELKTSDLHDYPFSKRSYFTLDLSKFTSSYDVEIMNADGEIIHEDKRLKDMFFTWQTQSHDNGIYWLKVSSKNATMMTKVLINRM